MPLPLLASCTKLLRDRGLKTISNDRSSDAAAVQPGITEHAPANRGKLSGGVVWQVLGSFSTG
jgi:hypothetical protein